MKALLNFIYKEKIADEEVTTELLVASDYYEIPVLRKICIEKLMKMMNVENVTDIWKTSLSCSMEKLAHIATVFMARNWKKMISDGRIQHAENFIELHNTISFLMLEDI